MTDEQKPIAFLSSKILGEIQILGNTITGSDNFDMSVGVPSPETHKSWVDTVGGSKLQQKK